MKSKWVAWEIAKHQELNKEGDRLIPLKFEKFEFPPELNCFLWFRQGEFEETPEGADARFTWDLLNDFNPSIDSQRRLIAR